MIESKIKGGSQATEYNIDEVIEQKYRYHIISEVTHGINANEFAVFYQPKVNMKTGEILGAEALIRWHHPQKGLCYPEYFLPYVENNEVMNRLSSLIFDEVFNQLEEWLKQGIDLRISINVSAHELQQENFFNEIKTKMEQYGNRLNRNIELELLESAAVRDIKSVRKIISQFHEIDLRISLDDFGTGYSSLSYLRALQVDAIKIDQSFINEISSSPKVIAIIDSILHMAKRFNQSVIAEGVDSLEKGILLLKLGCVEGQGYFIGKPMPVSEFQSWMESWKAPPEWQQQQSVYQENLDLIYAQSFIVWAVNTLSQAKKISHREMVSLESSLNSLAHYVNSSFSPHSNTVKMELEELIDEFFQKCKSFNTARITQQNRESYLADLVNSSQLLQKKIDLLNLKYEPNQNNLC
ncbi:EAL domain-containing protein [Legionella hackeliae]|nr:EAL domain-containing protein [Legionella hackeliae]KTD10438.1 sensory box protein (GGDEF domain/EAL domain) [Legionella hackeliae]